jgi:hypothetical protein
MPCGIELEIFCVAGGFKYYETEGDGQLSTTLNTIASLTS